MALRCLLSLAVLLGVSVPLPSQVYQKVFTPKGESLEIAAPHSLVWWTEDPLPLDAGLAAKNGQIVTARDYRFE